MKRPPRRQPPLPGGRLPVGSAFSPELERAIHREQVRWNASRSHVIATACAFALQVEDQPDYRTPRATWPGLPPGLHVVRRTG